ncbi:MAG TPA: hypothetical protein VNC61_08805 [Acidimicrobiales bacterium]|nr:hypothetical protein [Acidimicrobiales bacterium]
MDQRIVVSAALGKLRQPEGAISDTRRANFVVSGVLKVTASLILIGGPISVIGTAVHLHQPHTLGAVVFGVVAGTVAGTILGAAAIAFFGYVLDLLMSYRMEQLGRNANLFCSWR